MVGRFRSFSVKSGALPSPTFIMTRPSHNNSRNFWEQDPKKVRKWVEFLIFWNIDVHLRTCGWLTGPLTEEIKGDRVSVLEVTSTVVFTTRKVAPIPSLVTWVLMGHPLYGGLVSPSTPSSRLSSYGSVTRDVRSQDTVVGRSNVGFNFSDIKVTRTWPLRRLIDSPKPLTYMVTNQVRVW